ncbi:50S ribosomal protein 6, chloroplastic [Prosopis cineraria]|uniref:50S ribosomal protein 6, chloroplastic n=1 Tax=Prosopis cineraria TaxID=364024 RepID=UPI0024102737|nr:50S ribosomal protein 6, chloroplastic [Prosopis cineraria]
MREIAERIERLSQSTGSEKSTKMSVSAIFVSRLSTAPQSSPSFGRGGGENWRKGSARVGMEGDGLAIECSSRPNKKATAHHMKTRPKKTQPWDIKRKPTAYPPLPPLPPDWTLVSPAAPEVSSDAPPTSQPATAG